MTKPVDFRSPRVGAGPRAATAVAGRRCGGPGRAGFLFSATVRACRTDSTWSRRYVTTVATSASCCSRYPRIARRRGGSGGSSFIRSIQAPVPAGRRC